MKTWLLLLFGLCAIATFSTPQRGDQIIINNDTVDVFADESLPLNQFWDDFQDYLADTLFDTRLTSCRRGYVALWQLMNDSLFLVNLFNPIDNSELNWQAIFEKEGSKSPFFAHWFTGTLFVKKGSVLTYKHDGWGEITAFETVYSFQNGVINSVVEYANTLHESEYVLDLQKTIDFLNANLNQELISRCIKDSIEVFIAIHTSENERIADVEVLRFENEVIKQELARVVKLLPDWSAFYHRGKLERSVQAFPFVLKCDD